MSTMSPCGRVLLVILNLVGCTTLVIYYKWLANQQSLEHEYGNHGNLKNTNVTILLWHWPFGTPFEVSRNTCLEYQGVDGCYLTTDRSVFQRADFVVIHNFELRMGREKLPLHLPRPVNQKWVWVSLESPENNGNLRPLAGHFNYVMSYRRDADITIPYGKLVPIVASNGTAVKPLLHGNKSSIACWVVSNYSKYHKRTVLYEKLRRVMPVKVYGAAVKKRLSRESLLPTISRCYFYLAFENSIFKDYITEKFWYNGLMGGAVPVVLGPPREDYEAVAPNNSFIHVDDFSSVDQLGAFLKSLARDEKRYAMYFAWKQQSAVKLLTQWQERLCAICLKIDTLKPQLYKDLLTLKT